jgi:hypothetical protein
MPFTDEIVCKKLDRIIDNQIPNGDPRLQYADLIVNSAD